MDKEELLYRLKYLNWRPLLSVKYSDHRLIIRGLVDEGGKMYPKMKPVRFDIVIDNVLGPDADSLQELNEIMRRNFRGAVLEMWKTAWLRLEVII